VVDYAIFMLDPEGRVATWNEGAHRLKQYAEAEIVGRHFSVFYPPEAVAAGRPALLLGIAERAGRVEDEGWRVRKDGTRFWADVVITALRGEDGALWGFAKVTRDLTERKLADDSLRAALDREREAMDRLRETDRRRHELIRMVAHDLRAPVGVMHGTADMMLRDWGRLDENARLRMVTSLLATSDRLRGLVDDVLDVARIDAGSLRVDAVEVDLLDVVERAAADVDAGAQRVEVRLPEEPVTVRGDPRRIWQILTNLLGNAVKFSPAGAAVEVHVEVQPDSATVAVCDRGPGISEEDQRSLFQPFARVGGAAGSGHAGVPGTGLGLYIAQALAGAQGGSIAVRSAPGTGSTFSLSLPRAC
jgi:PAS domain S-box-containing protein